MEREDGSATCLIHLTLHRLEKLGDREEIHERMVNHQEERRED